MMMKPELVKRIKEYFHVNIYEAKVWLALLSKGVASAREVADLSGVPRSRTYDVLESLEKRGFAIIKIGKPVKYISVRPTEVLEKMKSNTLHDAHEHVTALSQLKDTAEYNELEQLHKAGIDPIKLHEITGSLRGRSNILTRLRELFENAQTEAIICTSAPDFEDKSRILVPALEKLMKNNIRVKLALSGDTEKVRKLTSKHTIKARQIDTPARFFIADKKEMIFMITPEGQEEEMAVWINSPFFTSSLSGMFEHSLKNNNGK